MQKNRNEKKSCYKEEYSLRWVFYIAGNGNKSDLNDRESLGLVWGVQSQIKLSFMILF